MKRFALIAILALLFTAACTDTYDGPVQDEYRYDLVTYLGYSDGNALFENVGRNDGASTYLSGALRAEPSYTKGIRVLLSYNLSGDSLSGTADNPQPITIKTVSSATTDTLRYTSKERIDTLGREDIQLISIWRTGNYINLQGEVLYTGKSRYFYLLADGATLDNDTVDCYLINNTHGQQTYNWRRFYASFYVGGALGRSTCSVVRVILNDTKFPDTHNYCFSKQE